MLILRFGALLLASAMIAQPSTRGLRLELDRTTYNVIPDSRFRGLVYLYVEDIAGAKGNPGFKPFNVHVLVGKYRAPMLGAKGYLRANDLEQLLSKGPDVWRDKMPIARAGDSKSFRPPGVVPFTLKVQEVLSVKGGGYHVVVEVL